MEEILDSRIRRGKLQYFIHWQGYNIDQRTWEPAENVENAPELIQQFHATYPNKPANKTTSTKS